MAAWLTEVEYELLRLIDLKQDWNSYGAPPIDTAITQTAYALAESLVAEFPTLSKPHVTPTVNGGVQLEWDAPDMTIEVECNPNEEPLVSFEDRRCPAGGLYPLIRALIQRAKE